MSSARTPKYPQDAMYLRLYVMIMGLVAAAMCLHTYQFLECSLRPENSMCLRYLLMGWPCLFVGLCAAGAAIYTHQDWKDEWEYQARNIVVVILRGTSQEQTNQSYNIGDIIERQKRKRVRVVRFNLNPDHDTAFIKREMLMKYSSPKFNTVFILSMWDPDLDLEARSMIWVDASESTPPVPAINALMDAEFAPPAPAPEASAGRAKKGE